ncbi:DUF6193 family natural product biosynthesis protein [Catenulispora sp. GAS73]|uniref:DUF6193 family natural product biosynthesis protein n=1 Tax=Catenulispora sp. GAS73 TaxID=3156269 RepID=UPI003512E00B
MDRGPGDRVRARAWTGRGGLQLLPYTSHWVLCFSRCTGNPYTYDVPCIDYVEGHYRVRWPGWGDTTRVLGEAATAEKAVALVVAHLPEGTGPAVTGTADELGL